jgi:hypothetical protein
LFQLGEISVSHELMCSRSKDYHPSLDQSSHYVTERRASYSASVANLLAI